MLFRNEKYCLLKKALCFFNWSFSLRATFMGTPFETGAWSGPRRTLRRWTGRSRRLGCRSGEGCRRRSSRGSWWRGKREMRYIRSTVLLSLWRIHVFIIFGCFFLPRWRERKCKTAHFQYPRHTSLLIFFAPWHTISLLSRPLKIKFRRDPPTHPPRRDQVDSIEGGRNGSGLPTVRTHCFPERRLIGPSLPFSSFRCVKAQVWMIKKRELGEMGRGAKRKIKEEGKKGKVPCH